MSEETRLVLQALIGLMVAVIAAFLTNLLNRRFFREQLGEQRYAEVYLDKMFDLWGEVLDIYHETTNWIGEMGFEAEQRAKKGLPKAKIDADLARIYEKKVPQLSVKVVALEKYYLVFPQPVVNVLREMEQVFTVTLRKPGEHNFAELIEVLRELNYHYMALFQHLRSYYSDLASRRITVSEILATPVDIVPPHVVEGLSAAPDRGG